MLTSPGHWRIIVSATPNLMWQYPLYYTEIGFVTVSLMVDIPATADINQIETLILQAEEPAMRAATQPNCTVTVRTDAAHG